jgi:hypothetical protein
MGFIQGVAAGAAIRDRNTDLYRPTNPALSYAGITEAPRAMGGRNVLGSPPEVDLGGMNPAAIHQKAAEMVLREKELDLAKTQALVDLTNAQAGAINQKRRSDILNQPTADEWLAGRNKQIEGEYQDRLKGIATGEAMTNARTDRVQEEDFRNAMFAAHTGNGEAVKEYINRYGRPESRVADIQFSPNGNGEVLVRFEGQDKPAFFASPEQLYKGLLFWTSPQSKKAVAGLTSGTKGTGTTKTGTEDQTVAPEKMATIRDKAVKEWETRNPSVNLEKLTPEQQKDLDDFIKKYASEVGAEGAGAIHKPGLRRSTPQEVAKATGGKKKPIGTVQFTKDGKKVKRTYFSDGSVDEGGEGEKTAPGKLEVVRTGKNKETGERVVQLSDGSVVPEKEFDYGNPRRPEDVPPDEEQTTASLNPEILDRYLHGSNAKGAISNPAEDLNAIAESARQRPAKLKEVAKLMNEGMSAYDAFKQVFGD